MTIALIVGMALVAESAIAEPDHTTYIVRLATSDPAALAAVERSGGVLDHFDGKTARAYVLESHWESFTRAGVPYTIEAIQPEANKQLDGYPSYDALTTYLNDIAATYPGLCRLSSLGRSVQGRELWTLKISDQPDVEEEEPEFAYISTLHGDEKVGTVMCLNFIEFLLEGYEQDPARTTLIDETEIWIIPLANPDGYELGIRWNANNIDLNRSFPDWPDDYSGTIGTEGIPDTGGRQPEVAHLMTWTVEHSPVLTANYHSGALVVNYPYDRIPGIPSGQEAPSPDDPLMRWMAAEYAAHNPPMLASVEFPGGITNGSAWYSVSGGLQDWQYRFSGAIDFTLEIASIKSPSQSSLPEFWDDNRDAMVAYLNIVHRGIRGLTTDRATGNPLFATVTIAGNTQPVFSDPDVGDFYRILLPGTYSVRADAPGYIPFTIGNVSVGAGAAARADIALSQGDVDGNGRVDALDLQLVINAILGRADTPAADVDGNGVSATDLQHLVNRVLHRP